jgi:hypothetical protein
MVVNSLRETYQFFFASDATFWNRIEINPKVYRQKGK